MPSPPKRQRRSPLGRVLLDRNESPFGVPDNVLRAWERQRTANPRRHGLNRYGDFFQTDMLSALQAHHGLTQLNYTPVGGQGEAATVLAAALFRDGGELVQSTPIGAEAARVVEAWGGRVRRVPLDDEQRQDLGALATAVGPATRLVHVQNPHDPSGTSFGQAQLEGLLAATLARNPSTYVWVDEAFAPYSRRSDFPDSFALIDRDLEGSRLIVSRSLETAHGLAGAPTGYLAASRALTAETEGLTNGFFALDKTSFGWANPEAGISRMGEKALLALLSPGGEAHLRRVSERNADARGELVALLERHGFDPIVASDAAFVFARAPGRFKRGGLARKLAARHKVVIRGSDGYGPRYRGWVRVSVGLAQQVERLDRALKRELGAPRPRPRAASGSAPPAAHEPRSQPPRSAIGRRGASRDRRALLAGGALAAAGLALPDGLRIPSAAAIHRPVRDDEPDRITRRRFAQVATLAAGGTAVLAGALARPPTARAFPPDGFYDSLDLARMIYHENPLGPSDAALEAIKRTIEAGPLAARRRQDDDRQGELVEAVLRYNRSRRKSVKKLDARNVMLTLGSAEALFLAVDTFVAGGTLVSEWPSYRIIRERVWQGRGTVVDIQLDPATNRPDYEAIKLTLAERPETAIVHFTIQNNPIGTVVQKGEFDAFAEHVFANHPRTIIVADESDPEYMEPGQAANVPDFPAYVARGKNLIHIQTLSHAFALTGLRVGYLLAPPKLIEAMRAKRIPRPVNVFGYTAALASLRDAKQQVERSSEVVRAGREYLYSELDGMGLHYLRSQGQYVMIDTGGDGSLAWAGLIGLGVLTREGREWGLQRWIRVNPGLPDENRRFIAALRTVLARPGSADPPTLPIELGRLLPRTRAGRSVAGGLGAMHRRNLVMEQRLPSFQDGAREVPASVLGLSGARS